MPCLEADLDFRRAGFRLAARIRVPETGITALVGPSGCGKTTVLRLLAGLERPRSGHIRHGEHVWFDRGRGIDLAPRLRRVGLMFQDYALFPHLSVARNVAFGQPRGDGAEAVRFWLERLQLLPFAERRPHALSGGQRQRVALARALASRPEVLLLDEPFSAVDLGLRQSLRLLFQEVVADRSMPTVLVTHDLDDVRHLADRVGVLVEGELRQFGPTAEVFSTPCDAEVARVLGWDNRLPVSGCEDGWVRGGWGCLRLNGALASGIPELVAIRPHGPSLTEGPGLEVEIARITDMGGYRTLLCRLPDRTALQIHLPPQASPPPPGTRTRLSIPEHCILPLPARGRVPAIPSSACN
ncbi:sulfate/molybdate ABC transporter ATP-binding protein [Imhoffiella purpurea]|uniref:ABC transporter n=1 Tax=Imhoffiella purpurea TaxID=1249627 RepID=W9VWY4_9GAMM|nr:ABC transporter ATP-binding protein [Imhoffiella purpurea]EXJ14925.1 ABC transporter [Imhoffiella purpurea]